MTKLEFDLSKAVNAIEKAKAKRVLVQMPEGLKTRAISLIEELKNNTEKKGIKPEFFLFVEPLFGACDLPLNEINAFNADLTIHFGHNEFMKAKKIVYVPGKYKISNKLLDKSITLLSEKLKKENIKKIAIAGIIQYLPAIKEIKKALEKKGIKCLTEKGKRTIKAQLLGCDPFAVKKVEDKIQAIVFVGDGLFHEMALSFSSDKKMFALNPRTIELKEVKGEKEKFLRKRFALIALAKKAKSFGIIVSTKAGQMRIANALRLKKLIEEKNRKAYIFISDLILPEFLLGINVDCYVNTACPRLIDDSFKFDKPLINAIELEIALGFKELKDFEYNAYF